MSDHCYIQALHLEGYTSRCKFKKKEDKTWNSNCEGSVALIECLVHFRKCIYPVVEVSDYAVVQMLIVYSR